MGEDMERMAKAEIANEYLVQVEGKSLGTLRLHNMKTVKDLEKLGNTKVVIIPGKLINFVRRPKWLGMF